MTGTFTKAFTTRIPLAVMIVTGIKRWENRSCFPDPYRGHCGMSCSKGSDEREYANFLSWAAKVMGADSAAKLPTWEQVKDWRGKMIAVMDYEAINAPSALNGPAALNEPSVLNAPAALNSNGGDSRSRGTRDPTGGFEITEEMLAWYEGYDVWWRLSNVEMLDEPFPVRGNVGMWDFAGDVKPIDKIGLPSLSFK